MTEEAQPKRLHLEPLPEMTGLIVKYTCPHCHEDVKVEVMRDICGRLLINVGDFKP
jgi:hypothetical protein